MASYSVHPDAVAEYGGAASYYQREASERVATAFIAEMEDAIQVLRGAPTTWRIIEEPEIRRFLLSHYAIMHTSRRPGYWRYRIASGRT